MFSILWMAFCAGIFAVGINGLVPESQPWTGACLGMGLGWLFVTLHSIERKIGK